VGFSRFFRLGRYLRCREIFRSPLRAHCRLSYLKSHPEPFSLDLIDGGTLHLPSPRELRKLWDVLLEDARVPLPVTAEDGLLCFGYEGLRIALRTDDIADSRIFQEVFLDDEYRIDQLEGPLGIVVDLGGNIGLFTARIARHAARVVTVEPVPANQEIARKNIEGADAVDKVHLLDRAVWAKSNETLRIYLHAENAGSHSFSRALAQKMGEAGSVDVETVSLADLFEEEGIDRCSLLKCDVEGAEYAIFLEAPEPLLTRIDRMVMEVHVERGQLSLTRFHEFRDKLERVGFTVQHGEASIPPGRDAHIFMLEAWRPRTGNRSRVSPPPSPTASLAESDRP
jgi:FkbM family methyltransferase